MTEFEECKECGGYCCVVPDHIVVNYLDRVRIAKELRMTPGQVTQQFTQVYGSARIKGYPVRRFKFTQPCIFWTQGRCGIYEARPSACWSYKPFEFCKERAIIAIKEGTAPYIPTSETYHEIGGES